ncbi:MAG: adenylyltransferase/cytidyltransferase family protein [Candidatus Roizmanbacteria bacterium]|nr:MAG: adenylyltransferase/cytidyltransferase family protein [Candidatus Roizmanbacteria bacterium]
MIKKERKVKNKIVNFSEIPDLKRKYAKKKIVLVGGCFDIFHFGHLTFLTEAKKQGDKLVIVLESDEFILKYKKREPIHNQFQRAQILSNLDIVDKIILLPLFKGYDDYLKLVRMLKPSVIAVTEGDERYYEKNQMAKVVKAQLKVVCSLASVSSTSKIIEYATFFGN